MIALTKGRSVSTSLFVCLRDAKTGGFTTNFYQAVSVDPSVSFSTPNRSNDVLNSIALNILAIAFPGEEIELPVGRCSTIAVSLHQLFADQVLSTMPEEGGNLPCEVVKDWAREISLNTVMEPTKLSA